MELTPPVSSNMASWAVPESAMDFSWEMCWDIVGKDFWDIPSAGTYLAYGLR